MILSKVPRAEWPQLKLKIMAASALKNRRPTWGQTRQWEGNYLSSHTENSSYTLYNESIKNLRNTQHFQNVLFSSFLTKFNRFNKVAERVLLVTDKALYKLDSTKFRNMKEGVDIVQLTGISVSPGRDQLIVLHCTGGNDFVVCLHSATKEDYVGELIGVLCNRYFE